MPKIKIHNQKDRIGNSNRDIHGNSTTYNLVHYLDELSPHSTNAPQVLNVTECTEKFCIPATKYSKNLIYAEISQK